MAPESPIAPPPTVVTAADQARTRYLSSVHLAQRAVRRYLKSPPPRPSCSASTLALADCWTPALAAEYDLLRRRYSSYIAWLRSTFGARCEYDREHLLPLHLSAAQWSEVKRQGHFTVVGSAGGTYRVQTDSFISNVWSVAAGRSLCAHLPMPVDVHEHTVTVHNLAQKQLIEFDEALWLETAL